MKLREYDGWRPSWTHITTTRLPDSDYSGLVLYDQAAGRGEILRCTGAGNMELFKASDGWRTSWTHVVGDFMSGSALLFYEAPTGPTPDSCSMTAPQGGLRLCSSSNLAQ